MSSPPHQLESTRQEGWDVDHPEEKLNNCTDEDKIHAETVEFSRDAGRLDEIEKALPRSGSPPKTGDDFDSGAAGAKLGTIYREKQINPNKVYVGGLPEHTRQEDLRGCFGEIGRIVSIELKTGFGFVEFADRQSAEESVAKYNEGYFMGNKICVELSRGGGRSAKFTGDAGACFKCGQMGHWAKECPNHVVAISHQRFEGTLMDNRARHPRGSRGYSPPSGDYRPSRVSRYNYHEPTSPSRVSSRDNLEYKSRDFRPTTSPSRDYRIYPSAHRTSRDVDDYRRPADSRGSYFSRYDTRSGYYSDVEYNTRQNHSSPRSYDPRLYDSSVPYDRRPPPSNRYPSSTYGRSRTPPRNDLDKVSHPRDYFEARGRPTTPPRFSENGRGTGDNTRYRRRSLSPGRPSSYGSGNYSTSLYNTGGYSSTENFSGTYPHSANRSSNNNARDRNYPSRSSRDLVRRP